MSKYPEHEKLRAVRAESITLSSFYDWLGEQGYHIARYHSHTADCYDRPEGIKNRKLTCGLSESSLYDYEVPRPEALFGLYFGIDPKKLSTEKDAMVDEMRATSFSAR